MDDSNFEGDQLANMSTDDIARASRLLDNELRANKVKTLTLTDRRFVEQTLGFWGFLESIGFYWLFWTIWIL